MNSHPEGTAAPDTFAAIIYGCAAAGVSAFWVSHDVRGVGQSTEFLAWLLLFASTLLFTYAYARRFLASAGARPRRERNVAIFHGISAAVAVTLFVAVANGSWLRSPTGDVALVWFYIPLVAGAVFCASALFLLHRKKSTLATLASIGFWPFWLASAVLSLNPFFEDSLPRTIFCCLALFTSVLFAVAAALIPRRPKLAHLAALGGLVALPYIYWRELMHSKLENVWIFFNVRNGIFGNANYGPFATLTIVSVSAVVLAILTAALRTLPDRWSIRNLAISQRTWPAFAACFLFLTVWFGRSVIPYRIPGAVDAIPPELRILHVEKHGLQFHETAIFVYRDGQFYETENHRRLFRYRFAVNSSGGILSQALMTRVQDVMALTGQMNQPAQMIGPIRAWNADNWYVRGRGLAILSYAVNDGSRPPPQIIGLFNAIAASPHKATRGTELRDVCLGFCYDPIAGLGWTYSNQRCHTDTHGTTCF